MAQWFGFEDIKELEKTTQTTLTWLAGSYIRIGGQAYSVNYNLVLDITTDIDTGSLSANKIYYIYAIVVGGTVSLVFSLSSSQPSGYSSYRKLGSFLTDGASEILGTSRKDEGKVGDIKYSRLTEEQFIQENGAGWVLYDGRDITNSKLADYISASVLEDARGLFLRAKDYGVGKNPDGDLALGVEQVDDFKSHNHTIRRQNNFNSAINTFSVEKMVTSFSYLSTSTGIENAGGDETRPKNLTVNIFIKINNIEL
jgi:hypothetical protein